MKRVLTVAIIVSAMVTNGFAQKFVTRTGQVSFFSSTPIENIEAINNEMAGIVDAKTGEVAFIVPIKSFKFAKAMMQQHFNESYMESDKYPKAEFAGKIANMSSVNFSKDGDYEVSVAGKLSIHGVTREVTIPGSVSVKGKIISVNSKFKVRNEDYSIRIPSLVSNKIAEEIEVTVNSVLNKK